MAIRAGKLDQRITFKIVTTDTSDEFGQPIETTTEVKDIPANARGMSAREKFESGRDVASEIYVFRVRYRFDVTTKSKISFNSNDYDIVSIIPKGRRLREFQDIIAERRDA